MRRGILLFGLSLSLVLAGSAEAEIKRHHKPWMGGAKHEPAAVQSVSSAPRKSVSKPSRKAIKPVPRVARSKYRSQARPAKKQQPIDEEFIEPVSQASPQGHQIAQKAVSYEGTRYRFGGTTKGGLDCSGLVNRVWNDLQMNKIPRASASLYQKGEPVKLAELQPGDLVFFKNTYKRGVSHVGIYTGKNKFVHANPRRGVTITKLSDPYYQLHYAGARRLY